MLPAEISFFFFFWPAPLVRKERMHREQFILVHFLSSTVFEVVNQQNPSGITRSPNKPSIKARACCQAWRQVRNLLAPWQPWLVLLGKGSLPTVFLVYLPKGCGLLLGQLLCKPSTVQARWDSEENITSKYIPGLLDSFQQSSFFHTEAGYPWHPRSTQLPLMTFCTSTLFSKSSHKVMETQ